MFELRSLCKEAIPGALENALRYRIMNDPLEAESICLDVLEIDPENADATITLLLALTEQFQERMGDTLEPALGLLARLPDEYARAYYRGIIFERLANARLRRFGTGAGVGAYEDLSEAMASYERAAEIRPRGNDDAILRWNTCARYLNRHPDLPREPEERTEEMLE
jgi:hypothetical protein